MALTPLRTLNGSDIGAATPFLMKASTTINKGDVVAIDSSGLAIPATATTTYHVGVASSTQVSDGSTALYIDVWTNPAIVYKAATDANTAQSQVGSQPTWDLKSAGVVDNAAHAVNVVRILKPIGAVGDKLAEVVLVKNILT